jgi:hypothetical protein
VIGSTCAGMISGVPGGDREVSPAERHTGHKSPMDLAGSTLLQREQASGDNTSHHGATSDRRYDEESNPSICQLPEHSSFFRPRAAIQVRQAPATPRNRSRTVHAIGAARVIRKFRASVTNGSGPVKKWRRLDGRACRISLRCRAGETEISTQTSLSPSPREVEVFRWSSSRSTHPSGPCARAATRSSFQWGPSRSESETGQSD